MGAGASVEAAPWGLVAKGAPALHEWCAAGGDPDVVSPDQQSTPLQAAARADDVESIEVLLRAGADINKATEHGTALHAAVSRCCHCVVQALLRRGADPRIHDAQGRTASDLAESLGYSNLSNDLRSVEGKAADAASASHPPAALAGLQAHVAMAGAGGQWQAHAIGGRGARVAGPEHTANVIPAVGELTQLAAPVFMALVAPVEAASLSTAPPAAAAPPHSAQRPEKERWQQNKGQQQQQQPARFLYPRLSPTAGQNPRSAANGGLTADPPKAQASAAATLAGAVAAAAVAAAPPAGSSSSSAAAAATLATAHPPQPKQACAAYPAIFLDPPSSSSSPLGAHLAAAAAAHPFADGAQAGIAALLAPSRLQQQGQQQPQEQALPPAPQPVVLPGAATTAAGAAATAKLGTPPEAVAGGGLAAGSAGGALDAEAAEGGEPGQSKPASPKQAPGMPASDAPPTAPAALSGTPTIIAHPTSAASASFPLLDSATHPGASSQAGSQANTFQSAMLDDKASQRAQQQAEGGASGCEDKQAHEDPSVAPSGTSMDRLKPQTACGSTQPQQQQERLPPSPQLYLPQQQEVQEGACPPQQPLQQWQVEHREVQLPLPPLQQQQPQEEAVPQQHVESLWEQAKEQQQQQQHRSQQHEPQQEGLPPQQPPPQQQSQQHELQQQPSLLQPPPQQPPPQQLLRQHCALLLQEVQEPPQLLPLLPASPLSQQQQQQQIGPTMPVEQHQLALQQQQQQQQQNVPIMPLEQHQPALQQQQQQQQAKQLQGPAFDSSSDASKPSRRSRRNSLPDIHSWEIKFEDLQLQRLIGEGSYGKVWVAKWHETQVSVKILLDVEEAQRAAGPQEVWRLSHPILASLQKECALMAAMRHPNIVQFMGVSACPPAMITEWCGKGSLTDVLQAAKQSPQKAALLTWARRLHMLLDAAKGMLYLHRRSPPIIHRDLKSPNLLVDSTWNVKVADFNVSKIVVEASGDSLLSSTMANLNPRWLAPEIVAGSAATPASDVYSFAIVMWEVMTWQLPFGRMSPWTVLNDLLEGKRPSLPAGETLPGPSFPGLPAYVGLMQRCWAQEAEQRPGFQKVIQELRALLEQVVTRPAGEIN